METTELNIRDILASNIKENRRKCGFSQEKLAERAGISTPFVAMIEVSRKFPTPAVLDRIAGALNIKTHQLFTVPPSPEDALALLRQDIVGEIEEIVVKAIKETLAGEHKSSE